MFFCIKIKKKKIILYGLLLMISVFAFTYDGFSMAVIQGSSQKPIYYVETNQKEVAISFDAAWGAEETLKIMDTVESYGLKTTFFVVKFWVEDYPEVAKAIVERGHELENHSASHPHFNSLSKEDMKKELRDTSEAIYQKTGHQCTLFRPPFGEYNDTVIDIVFQEGLIPIQWSKDSLDWKDLSAMDIVDRVMKDLKGGDIILFHNNGTHTLEAIEILIPKLLDEGYDIIPIGDLIYRNGYEIDPISGAQRKISVDEDTGIEETIASFRP